MSYYYARRWGKHPGEHKRRREKGRRDSPFIETFPAPGGEREGGKQDGCCVVQFEGETGKEEKERKENRRRGAKFSLLMPFGGGERGSFFSSRSGRVEGKKGESRPYRSRQRGGKRITSFLAHQAEPDEGKWEER